MSLPIEVGQLAAEMNADCEGIALDLIPDLHVTGPRMTARGLLGGAGDQFSIKRLEPKRGRWAAFGGVDIPGAPEKGDMLDLVAWILFNGDKGQAIRWGLARYGYTDAGPETRAKIAERREELRRRQAERARQAEADDARRMGEAFFLWRAEAVPIVDAGGGRTPAARYLEGRGIDLGRIPSLGALRFHPKIKPQAGDPFAACMVAVMVDSLGQVRSCHRTALEIRADGSVTKSPRVASAKTIMGRPKGAFVAINRGATNKTMRNAEKGETLLMCEGIEDALTLAMARPDLRIVAAGTIGLMADVAPPPAITRLVIYRDDDTGNVQAEQAFARVLAAQMERAAKVGRTVHVAKPPAGFKDANDALMGKPKAGGRFQPPADTSRGAI